MGRKNKSLVYQVSKRYDGMLAIGESKKAAKAAGTAHQKIFSWDTYHSYLKHARYFTDYVKAEHSSVRTLEEAREYVEAFLQHGIDRGLSAYSLSLQAAALAKLYGCHSTDFNVKLPSRSRAKLTRSRGEKVRDRDFNEVLHADLVTFCRCTGLRRAELKQIRGEDLRVIDDKYYLEITRGTKGGRPRTSPLIGTEEEICNVVEQLRIAGKQKVYPDPSGHADIHSYRAEYAKRIYDAHARDLAAFKNERLIMFKNTVIDVYESPSCRRDASQRPEIYLPGKKADGSPIFLPGWKDVPAAYYCQRDLKKVVYDRTALLVASQALGHNRESVVTEHYLRA